MRKLKYHCATSIDGFVALPDGSFDFFAMQGPHVDDFVSSVSSYDTAIMGRKTYDVGARVGVTNPYPSLETYVFSRTLKESPDPAVRLISANAAQVVGELKRKAGKDIWLVGAGELAATLFAENLVDEVTLKVNPLLLGSGIPLVALLAKPLALRLLDSKTYDNGVVLLRYGLR